MFSKTLPHSELFPIDSRDLMYECYYIDVLINVVDIDVMSTQPQMEV